MPTMLFPCDAGCAIMRVVVMLLVLTLWSAGCAENPVDEEPEDEAFDELDTKATADTGVIRGIVVDATITPVDGVLVAITNTPHTTQSNADGAFAFEGLEPGFYFLSFSKLGWQDIQVQAEVVAGVDRPAIVKVQMAADPSNQPYVQVEQFDGFIQCSNRFIVIGLATCATLGFGDDDFSRNYEPSFRPQWVQSELVWESTQVFGEELSYSITCLSGSPCPDGQLTIARHEGTSPLLLQVNQTLNEQFLLGAGEQPISVRVFAHGHSSTDIPEETIYDTAGIDCVQWPVIFAECIRFGGFGMVLDQQFTGYTHIFNLHQPPEGWRFTADGAPPEP